MAIKRYIGQDYLFEVESTPAAEGVWFSITAIDRASGHCSRINTLNAILSQFDFEDDDPRMEESDWLLSVDDYQNLRATAEGIFGSRYTLEYIESNLDDDRWEGEWVNARKVWWIQRFLWLRRAMIQRRQDEAKAVQNARQAND